MPVGFLDKMHQIEQCQAGFIEKMGLGGTCNCCSWCGRFTFVCSYKPTVYCGKALGEKILDSTSAALPSYSRYVEKPLLQGTRPRGCGQWCGRTSQFVEPWLVVRADSMTCFAQAKGVGDSWASCPQCTGSC
jgi:hypothetical protein